MIRATLWDFGGVVTTSPFEAFAAYERNSNLPDGLVRRVNSTNPDTNAWARLERNDVDIPEFVPLFEAEAAALGFEVDGHAVLACLSGDVRPQMAEAVRRCSDRLVAYCLTNNFRAGSSGEKGSGIDADDPDRQQRLDEVRAHFTEIIESSLVGLRKPDPKVYELACQRMGVEPHEVVFLDDLGINLKPAREMGMTTIKVVDPDVALAELEEVVGFALR